MPSLKDLNLTNDAVGENLDYDAMPDQMGGFADPPQPGDFRFRFPSQFNSWAVTKVTNVRNPGDRVAAVFDSSCPLVIVQSPKGVYNGDPFETRISNAERKRGKRDDPTAPEVSDMDYIFRDVFAQKGKPNPPTNRNYAETFQRLAANKEFSARVEWSWNCRDDKNIRVLNDQGGVQETDQKGCGTRYYQKDVEKVPSNPDDPNSERVFPVRIQCQCGAQLRAFANLAGFKP